MNPTVLAWALAQGVGTRWRLLVDAYTAGTTRVVVDGRTVEYRSVREMSEILSNGYAAENPAQRRAAVSRASFVRASGA